MRFDFKKIASGAASLAMIGSTVALAAAASFPAPFVDGGSADVAIVYGSAQDLSAVTDISTALSSATSGQTGGSTGTPTGDYVVLSKTNDNLNFGNTWSNPFGTNIDDEDMPVILADGTYTADDKDEFDYEQKISLGSPSLTHFRDSDYEDLIGAGEDTPTVGFHITSNTHLMNYTLDFLEDAESDVVSSDLADFEGSTLPLLGREFYVSDWKNGTTAGSTGKLTLLDTANTAIVEQEETITINVGGTAYEVSIDYIDEDSASLLINGETTDDLGEGQTEKISGDVYVGIKDVRKLAVAGEIGSVEFSLGVGKLELTHGSEVQLNTDPVDGVTAYLHKGTSSSGVEKIDKLVLQWKTDDEIFLTPETELEMPGFNAVKFTMNDLVRPDEEEIEIRNDGDDSIEVNVPFKDGAYSINLLYSNGSGDFAGIGKASDERLATTNKSELIYWNKKAGNDYHEYVVVSYNSTDSAESYVLSFDPVQDNSEGRNETKITNRITSNSVENKVAGDDYDLGDISFTINTIGANSTDEWVNITAASGVTFHHIFTEGGLMINLPYEAANTTSSPNDGAINLTDGVGTAGYNYDKFYLFMHGENKDDDLFSGTKFSVTLDDNSDNDLQVSAVNTTGGGVGSGTGGANGKELGDTQTYEAYVIDDVAPRLLHYTDGDQDHVEVFYPGTDDSETYAEVFVTDISESSGGGSAGNFAVMDDELAGSGMQTKNLIIVGGTCVNSAASTVLGLTGQACGSSWTAATGAGEGEWVIQTFDNPWSSSKIATLVAGWAQSDTYNAATALRNLDAIDISVGTKYEGSTATAATPVVA